MSDEGTPATSQRQTPGPYGWTGVFGGVSEPWVSQSNTQQYMEHQDLGEPGHAYLWKRRRLCCRLVRESITADDSNQRKSYNSMIK